MSRFLFLALLACFVLPVQAGQTIRVGGDRAFPPYEFFNDAGEPDGFHVDLIAAISRTMHFDMETKLGSWSRMRQDLLAGNLDVVPMCYSRERGREVDFSMPHTILYDAIFIRAGSPEYRSLDDVRGKRIIVQESDLLHELALQLQLTPNLIVVDSHPEALHLLANGAGDCALLAKAHGVYYIRKNGLKGIRTTGPPINERRYCFAVKEGNQELLATLNEGLIAIKSTGEYDRIYNKWFGVIAPQGIPIQTIRTYLSWILPVTVLIIATALCWVWSLRKAVQLRTAALHTANLKLANEMAEREKDHARFMAAFRNAPVGIAITHLSDGRLIEVNDSYLALIEYSREEVIGRNVNELEMLTPDQLEFIVTAIREQSYLTNYEMVLGTKTGEKRTVQTSIALAEIEEDLCLLHMVYDITEQKQLAEQLRQSQKLEAIGRLAGGIAHDFNNLLTGIIGFAQLGMARVSKGSALREDLEQIYGLGNRAARLTRQLLVFSRRHTSECTIVDVNLLVEEISKLLDRLIGEHISLELRLGDIGNVVADPHQIEQALMNLVVNARDAMPKGGKITIETADVVLDQEYADTHLEVTPGSYVMLAVSDSGCGMDEKTRSHMFEPFFTTKGIGQGTGLGLSTVYGIVKQHKGFIWVYSEVGRGTVIKVYLPRVETAVDTITSDTDQAPTGTETILVVDDEEAVREVVRCNLEHLGYNVLVASCLEEAEYLVARFERRIDLLLTDIVLPGTDGRELWLRLSAIHPSLRVMYMSGYTNNSAMHQGIPGEDGSLYLEKPFSPDKLGRKVREALDRVYV